MGAGEIVMLHLWLRQHKVNGSLSMTGVGFLESLSYTHTWAGIDLIMADPVNRLSSSPFATPPGGLRSSVNRAAWGCRGGGLCRRAGVGVCALCVGAGRVWGKRGGGVCAEIAVWHNVAFETRPGQCSPPHSHRNPAK